MAIEPMEMKMYELFVTKIRTINFGEEVEGEEEFEKMRTKLDPMEKP